jgi:hypothetical protein
VSGYPRLIIATFYICIGIGNGVWISLEAYLLLDGIGSLFLCADSRSLIPHMIREVGGLRTHFSEMMYQLGKLYIDTFAIKL